MKNNLGLIGVIIMAFMLLSLVGLFSNEIGSTTPIDKPNKPTVPDDLCWYVEFCPEE